MGGCARLSAMLKTHGIVAKYNIQDCDRDVVFSRLAQDGFHSCNTLPVELAEIEANVESPSKSCQGVHGRLLLVDR